MEIISIYKSAKDIHINLISAPYPARISGRVGTFYSLTFSLKCFIGIKALLLFYALL